MSRWRHSGVNWENRQWATSFPIRALADQLDALYPEGGATDGTVASKQHDAVSPNSDHRPTPHTGFGLVRALDVHVVPASMIIPEILRLNEDDRIKYVIFNGRVFSGKNSATPFVWRDYDGPNPHATHFHLSVLDDADADRGAWDLTVGGGDDELPTPQDIWFYPIPDMDDFEGTRGAAHALRQAWGFSRQAALDAAVSRALIEKMAANVLTTAEVDDIANATVAAFKEAL